MKLIFALILTALVNAGLGFAMFGEIINPFLGMLLLVCVPFVTAMLFALLQPKKMSEETKYEIICG